ncbi:MAG: hypothetical protein JHD07_19845 [Bradyrhizobium sp.]|uniref:hypothetical protein n=1 Tax=Bradyrhizobium sp. TaxID=376 RepID=UPI001A194A89|nr:hypothetical protein [Bradyrhizobium sp.]MBJ7405432.1 hypothetical protein [Bradyrhizobium sp.]
MPVGFEDMLPPLAPSVALDGLDLTPAEIRALSSETFVRVFTLPSFDHVPVVGPGFLRRRPPGAEWWLRFRAKPKSEKGPESPSADPTERSKDRQSDSWLLVFKAPVYAPPEAGGGVAISPDTMTLKAKDVEGAKAEALIMIARGQRKTIRATTWPIERIERLNCKEMLQAYLDVDLKKPEIRQKKKGEIPRRRGKARKSTEGATEVPEDEVKANKAERKLWRTYRAAIEAFQDAFPTLEIGDCKGRIDMRIDQAFEERALLEPSSRFAYLKTVQMALNAILERKGVPETYRVKFANKDPGPLVKPNWTLAEYDRLMASSRGWCHHPGGAPKMVDIAGCRTQLRRLAAIRHRKAWSRMIPFLAYSVSRNGQIHLTRWVPGSEEPGGRQFARGEERPWLEVLDDCIVFHRDGNERYDGNKRHGWNFVPKEFEPEVRRWYEEDMAAGIEWVFHKPDGERYGECLPSWTFRQIVADAGLPKGTTAHSLKDLAMAWADAAGVPRPVISEHADTSEKTIDRNYGPTRKVDVLETARDTISQKPWRAKEERRAAQVADFRARRDEAYAKAAAAKADARLLARRAKDAKRASRKRAAAEAPAPGPSTGVPAAAPVVPLRPARPAAGDMSTAAVPLRRRAAVARAPS